MPLLITWSTTLKNSQMDFRRELDVLSEWADSEDGQNLYKQLAIDVQDPRSVEQLALNTAALMNYRRIRPDLSDNTDQPITCSYLVDLDALFHGHSLGNSGRVAEQMVFAFIRVLRRMPLYNSLVVFLETILDREPPLLHSLNGLADQYLSQKILGQTHENAFETVIEAVSHLKMPELRKDADPDWVHIPDDSPGACNDSTLPVADTRCVHAPLGLHADDYTLIRLSNVEPQDLLETLDETIGRVHEVPNIERLSDGSWEICVLKSYCLTAQSTLREAFPNPVIDLHYNPLEPTAKDVKLWGYKNAKKLHRQWFFERAMRIVMKGWLMAATYYSNLLRLMFGLGEAAAGSMNSDSSGQPLVPTYRGFIPSKEDAVYLLEACLSGELLHSCRGPRDGEAATSGNIFVWENNSTGIDHWQDGVEWAVQNQGDCEVSEAMNGSGLMKKTFSIRVNGVVHHVVSYYTVWDARTLPRLPRSMTVRPELACALTA